MTDIAPERGSGRWQRSARSGAASNCVEVDVGDVVAVRDSKHPESVLHLAPEVWADFLDAVKRGEFDR